MSDTEPEPMSEPASEPTSEPTSAISDADNAPRPVPGRRPPTPVVRWIRGLSRAAFAGILLAVVVALLLVAVLVNRGERVGPVRPATPPVGGPGLPATRL